ncbi:hypothetical protein Tco_0671234 [Tanacetum coccineum]
MKLTLKNFDDKMARLRQTEFLLRSFKSKKETVHNRKGEMQRNFKHSELEEVRKFEDLQAMYEKIKREEIKQESKQEVKEEDKGEENTRKRKHGTRKKIKSRKRRFRKQGTSQDDPSDIRREC